MSTVTEVVEVDVPVQTAYRYWTRFEQFSRFMEGVHSVKRTDDTHLHWIADIGGTSREWDAEIVEQRPDAKVAWRAIDGADNAGEVTLQRLDARHTRIRLRLEFDPEGFAENAVARRAALDLDRFKAFVEASSSS